MGLLPYAQNQGLRVRQEFRKRDARAVMHVGIAN